MTPAVEAARAAGVAFEILEYEHDPGHESYGLEAVEALNLDPAAVFKTLVATVGAGGLVVAVVPVMKRLDLKALAKAVGAKRAAMVHPAVAQRATGYVVGGISPLGTKRRLVTAIDQSATQLEFMHCSAGRRGTEIGMAPMDLVTLTAAVLAPIAS
ncbi:MAG: Cys-tRNA(Pro)/Cys-tRNA(Cys) deacylase [Candidatus Poriferisodalaceae bacterium]